MLRLKSEASLKKEKRSLFSALSLLLAFVLGQGSIFLVSSYFLYLGKNAEVAELGLSTSMYSLAAWIADLGGVYYLSAYIKRRERAKIRAFLLGRYVCVFLLGMGVVGLHVFELLPSQVDAHIVMGLALVTISSCGLAGVYDGLKKTSSIAIYSSLPWVLSSASVLVLNDSFGYAISEIVGFCFVLGNAVYVAKSSYLGFRLKLYKVSCSYESVVQEIRCALSYLLSYMAGQLYGRTLLVAGAQLLDQRMAAIFVYSRQVYNAISQVVIFLRRAEGVGGRNVKVYEVFRSLSVSTIFSWVIALFVLFSSFLFWVLYDLDRQLLILVFSSSLCLVVWTYFNGLFFFFLGASRLAPYLLVHSFGMTLLSVALVWFGSGALVIFMPLFEAFVLVLESVALIAFARTKYA